MPDPSVQPLSYWNTQGYDTPFDYEDVPDIMDLPAYAPPSLPHHARRHHHHRPVEHIYTNKDGKGRAWLTLKLRSWARSSTALPNFLEGHRIHGQVTLDLDKPDAIQSICVKASSTHTLHAPQLINARFINLYSLKGRWQMRA